MWTGQDVQTGLSSSYLYSYILSIFSLFSLNHLHVLSVPLKCKIFVFASEFLCSFPYSCLLQICTFTSFLPCVFHFISPHSSVFPSLFQSLFAFFIFCFCTCHCTVVFYSPYFYCFVSSTFSPHLPSLARLL